MRTLALLFFFFMTDIYAQDFLKDTNPCQQDYKKYCTNKTLPVLANDFECLHLELDSLQTGCQQYLVTSLASKLPCMPEVMKLCPGKEKNLNNSSDCLLNRFTSLSKVCKSWYTGRLGSAREATKDIDAACAKDRAPCAALKGRGEGACMDKLYVQNKLSPQCKTLFEKHRKK